MTKEFREGERDERPKGERDELEELRGHIKARREEAGKEGAESRSRATEEGDPADRPGGKDSVHPESAEGSSERAAENHAEQPEVKNEINEGDARQLETKDERGRDEELGRLRERVKERHESEADEEKHEVDQEKGNPGNGPVEERAQDDVREEPKALTEQLSRESEAPQNPELKGRGERAEENPTNPVLGEVDREGQPPVQEAELDRPLPTQNPAAQPDMVSESKGQVDSSVVSEGSEPPRMVQAGGVRFEVGDLKPPMEEELLQDGVPVNPQPPEIGVVLRHGDESQLSQQSSVRTGSLDSRVTEGDSRAFGGAALGSAGKETETKVQGAEGGPPKETEPRLSIAEAGAQNLISRKLSDLEATADFHVELGKANAFQHGHVPKDGSGSHDDASLARKESLDTTSAICAKAYHADLDYPSIVRLEILRTRIEERTGVRMERDKLYHIRGSVEGIYGFEVYQASRPSIRLHVPSEYRDRVEAGKIYNVHIKSINEVPLTDTQREILLWSKKGTRWKAVLERSSQVKVGLAEGTHDDWRSRKAYLLRTLKSDAYPDLVVAKPQYFGRVALGHGLGLGLRIPHTIVEKYKKNDLLEARVARISRPDEEYLLYTRVQYKQAHVCISQMRPANGEEFCIKSLRGFGKTDFARQFNERKPAGMWSTALICDGGKVFLRVDNLQAELRNCRLKAHSGNVVLEANLIDDTKRGSIRIVKRPQEFTVGFADRTRVTAMKGFGGKIEATYRVHSREPRPHVRIVEARAIGDPKSQGKAELQERELGLMSREEIRGWIDGEGHIECKPKKRFGSQIIITQKSREP